MRSKDGNEQCGVDKNPSDGDGCAGGPATEEVRRCVCLSVCCAKGRLFGVECTTVRTNSAPFARLTGLGHPQRGCWLDLMIFCAVLTHPCATTLPSPPPHGTTPHLRDAARTAPPPPAIFEGLRPLRHYLRLVVPDGRRARVRRA